MAGSSESPDLYGWEISALFALFMVISCVWQVFIAIITFLNSFYGGAKTIWLTRLKEEVLDVGVISLALVFVQPWIANICVAGSSAVPQEPTGDHSESPYATPGASPYPSPAAAAAITLGGPAGGQTPGRQLLETVSRATRRLLGGGEAVAACPAGRRHLFPVDTIVKAHYLLFFVALVHIIYSLFTFTLTLQRFANWARWEQRQRQYEMDAATDLPEHRVSEIPRGGARMRSWLERVCCWCCGRWAVAAACWRGFNGGVDPERYMVLRGLFRLRARACRATAFGGHNLHYANVCENAMQIDIENVVAHGWLVAFIVAIFTLYTTEVYQIVWIGGSCILLEAVVVWKLQSVMSAVLGITQPVSGDRFRINTASRAFQGMALGSEAVRGGASFRTKRLASIVAAAAAAAAEEDEEEQAEDKARSAAGGNTQRAGRPRGAPASGASGAEPSNLRYRDTAGPGGATVTGGGGGGGGGGDLIDTSALPSDVRRAGRLPYNSSRSASAYAPPPQLQPLSRGPGPVAEGRGEGAAGPVMRVAAAGRFAGWQGAGGGTGFLSVASGAHAEADSHHLWWVSSTAHVLEEQRTAGSTAGGPWRGGGLPAAAAPAALPVSASPWRSMYDAAAGGAGAAVWGCTAASWHEDGSGTQVRGPGPVAEANDWSFGGAGGGGGARASRTAAPGSAQKGAVGQSKSGDRSGSTTGAAARGGGGAAAAAAAGGKPGGGGVGGNKAGGRGGGGGRVNILARGGSDREVQLAGRGGVGAAASRGTGAGGRGGGMGARSGSGEPQDASSTSAFETRQAAAAAAAALGSSSSSAANDDSDDAALDFTRPPVADPFLVDGFTFGRSNPLYDMEHLDVGMPELLGGGAGGAGGGHLRNGTAAAADPAAAAATAALPLPLPSLSLSPGANGARRSPASTSNGDGGAGGGGEFLDPAPSARFANPLFREGSVVSNSFTKAAAAAAAASAAVAASARTTAPLSVDEEGQLAPPPPPLPRSPAGAANANAAKDAASPTPPRAAPTLGWRAPPPPQQQQQQGKKGPPPAAAVAAAAAAAGGPSKQSSAKRLFGLLHLGSWGHSTTSAPGAAREPVPEAPSPGGRWRRSSFAAGDGDAVEPLGRSGSSVLLPAAAAERRRLVNLLYVDQPHLPILDVPPPPSNTGVVPPLETPNMASPRAAAAAAGSTVVAAAELVNGGPVVWLTAPEAAEGVLSPSTVMGGSSIVNAAAAARSVQSLAAGANSATRLTGEVATVASATAPVAAGAAVPPRPVTAEAGCQASPPPSPPPPPPPPPPVLMQTDATATRRNTCDAGCQTMPPPPPLLLPHVPEVSAAAVAAAAAAPSLPDAVVAGSQRPVAAPLAALFEPYTAEAEDDEAGDGVGGADGAHDDAVGMEVVERKLRGLFWWGRPQLLLWTTHVIYLQNSLSMTLCLYYMLSYDTSSSILPASERLLVVWLPLLAANLGLMLYIGYVVVPLYTLVTTTCTRNPRALQEHIRRHKKVEEEEGGIVGLIVEQCTRCFHRSHHEATRHHARHGSAEGAELNALFLANLANQAGVVMAGEAQRTAARLGSTGAVYQQFLLLWLYKSRARRGIAPRPPGGMFRLQADVSEFRSAFTALDHNGSGSVTTEELFTHLLLAGTRATRRELRAMVAEIDNDGNNQVDFSEFLTFMVFCFLDQDGNGCLEAQDVVRASRRVKVRLPESDLLDMMDMADPDRDGKIGLRQFALLYRDVDMPDLEDSGGGALPGDGGVQPAGHLLDGGSTAAAAAAASAPAAASGGSGGGFGAAPSSGIDDRSPSAVVQDARMEMYRRLRVRIPHSPNAGS